MELVYEDDIAAGFELVDYALHAFFKLTAIHRTSDYRTDIQLEHTFIQQQRGHIAFDDTLRQPLYDSGLANTGLANQSRVILGAPCQNLDHAFYFLASSDNRVELAFLCQGSQVCSKLVYQRGFAFVFFFSA